MSVPAIQLRPGEKPIFGGVDVGQYAHFPCVIDLEQRAIRYPDGFQELDEAHCVAWLKGQRPIAIAIDSPPLPNNSALESVDPLEKPAKRRVAEYCLGIGGCYRTPDTEQACKGWMQSGMSLYRALTAAFGWQPDLGGTTERLLEVHPTYAFKALIKHINRARGKVTCDPDHRLGPKTTSRGRNNRVKILRRALTEIGIDGNQWESKWLSRIDWADATIAALISCWRVQDSTLICQVGCPSEGSINLRYADWDDLDFLASYYSSAPTSSRSPSGDAHFQWVLRLGANGPGGFSQEDTLESLTGELETEDETWLPVDVASISGIQRALSCDGERCELALAFNQNVCARVYVGEASSGGDVGLRWDDLTHSSDSPWTNASGRCIETSRNWLRVCDLYEGDLPAEEIKTWQKGEWRPGYPPNQTALLRCLLPRRT